MRGGSARLAIRDATGEEGSHDDRLGQGDLQQVRRPKGFRSTFDTIRTGNNASDSGVRAQETACPATSPVLATYSTTHTVTHTPEPRSLSWGELHAGVLSAVLCLLLLLLLLSARIAPGLSKLQRHVAIKVSTSLIHDIIDAAVYRFYSQQVCIISTAATTTTTTTTTTTNATTTTIHTHIHVHTRTLSHIRIHMHTRTRAHTHACTHMAGVSTGLPHWKHAKSPFIAPFLIGPPQSSKDRVVKTE